MIVIAHRVSTIVDLPRILVLDGGRSPADGTHATLLRTSAKYRSLYAPPPDSQLRDPVTNRHFVRRGR